MRQIRPVKIWKFWTVVGTADDKAKWNVAQTQKRPTATNGEALHM
jgi:hypothetical protein